MAAELLESMLNEIRLNLESWSQLPERPVPLELRRLAIELRLRSAISSAAHHAGHPGRIGRAREPYVLQAVGAIRWEPQILLSWSHSSQCLSPCLLCGVFVQLSFVTFEGVNALPDYQRCCPGVRYNLGVTEGESRLPPVADHPGVVGIPAARCPYDL